MISYVNYIRALCTSCALLVMLGGAFDATSASTENFAHYKKSQIQWGATALPLAAQIEYAKALREAQRGDRPEAINHLNESIALAPNFPDAYFTLARLKFMSMSTDALYYFVGGIKAMGNNFHAQGLLAVNLLLMSILVLVIVASIVCTSLAIRYLPFLAHRIAELLRNRFGAAASRLTAYLLILTPFVIFPGFVTGFCTMLLLTWHFMHRRERFIVCMTTLPFVILAVFAPRLQRLAPITNPTSFTTLAALSATSAGEASLTRAVEATDVAELETEKQNTLGLLHLRQENFETAAGCFLRAIALRPDDATAYVNLGNVYFRQGQYEKALEGYRKAERLNGRDAVGQYNLAQAYIKTLLMAESSNALRNASNAGINKVKASYATSIQDDVDVYEKPYGVASLWRIAAREGRNQSGDIIDGVITTITRFSLRTGAVFMIAALALTLILGRLVKEKHLAFQCSNCGAITCEDCCGDERGSYICMECAASVEAVTSDKVMEALLRQRRQATLVKRRRAIRVLTMWLPGMRDIFYGRLIRGLTLAVIFAVSLIQIWFRGYIIQDWNLLYFEPPLWKLVLPAAGLTIAYLFSLFARQYLEVRNYRNQTLRHANRRKEDELKLESA